MVKHLKLNWITSQFVSHKGAIYIYILLSSYQVSSVLKTFIKLTHAELIIIGIYDQRQKWEIQAVFKLPITIAILITDVIIMKGNVSIC